jgi:CRP-like cAMP-binding protein
MSLKRETGEDERRPKNSLLQCIPKSEYQAIRLHLEEIEGRSGQVLYHPGDVVEHIYFPCGGTLISFVVAVEEDRNVDALLVGREGAVGGVISRGFLPTYSGIAVKIGGQLVRLSCRRLDNALRQSSSLRQIFTRYADGLLAQMLQSTACNAAHSIEQRAAKWIVSAIERAGTEHVPLTHEQLAGLLGIGRSYASRVIQHFKADGILQTGRGMLSVRDVSALQRRSCKCDFWVQRHFAEVAAIKGAPPDKPE